MLRLLATFLSLILMIVDPQAADLLAQARAALGGDTALSKVHGLSMAGTIQRLLGDRTVDGELTFDLELPDKMLRTDAIRPMGDQMTVVTGQGINGDSLLRSMRVLNAPAGAMVRTPPSPPPGSDAEAQALRNSHAELARITLALLLTTPASFPVEMRAAGQAESPDGKADVIDVKGPGAFAARLFLDASSHRPLMLTYRGMAPRIVVQTRRGDDPPPAAAEAPKPTETVDIAMFLDDYRPVDGVLLPHHITRSIDGKPTEEWTLKTIKLNPTFKPDAFAGEPR